MVLKLKYCIAVVVFMTHGCRAQNASKAGVHFNERLHAVQRSGTECTLHISKQFFSKNSIVCVVTSGIKHVANVNTAMTTDMMILNALMSELRWTMMMKTGRHFKESIFTIERVQNYVIFLQTKEDVDLVLVSLVTSISWNPGANFFLYVDKDLGEAWNEFTVYCFRAFWKLYVINISIMVPDAKNYVQRIVTWYPFDAGNCGSQDTELVQVGVCASAKVVPQDAPVFPEKVPLNLNQCPIIITTVVSPPYVLQPVGRIESGVFLNFTQGIEIKLINVISFQANFKINFKSFGIEEDWGEIYPNNSGSGIMGELLSKRTDIGIGTLTPTLETHSHFDFTVQYTQDGTTWIVPIADTVAKWRSIIDVFQPFVWLASIITYVGVSFMVAQLGKYDRTNTESESFKQLYFTFLFTWCTMLASALNRLPITNRLRIFVFVWSLFCIHWSLAYTSGLVSRMTTPIYGDGLTTFQDILDSGIEFGMTTPTTRYFETEQYATDELARYIMNHYNLCPTAVVCLKRAAQNKDFAMAVSRQFFEYVKNDYRDAVGTPLLRALKQNIVSPPIEMLLVKGHPLLKRIDNLLLRIIQAGLIDLWRREIRQEVLTDTFIEDIDFEEKTDTLEALTLDHLQGAFMALGLGLLLAGIAFVIEISAFRYYLNKQKKCKTNNEVFFRNYID